MADRSFFLARPLNFCPACHCEGFSPKQSRCLSNGYGIAPSAHGLLAMTNGTFFKGLLTRMISILSLVLCLAWSPTPAFPAKGCLPELLISPDSILAERALKKEWLLVDIRPSAAFEKLRIPGSLNIPVFAIKEKTFLKKYDLVLVDEGYRCARIEEDCRYLRRAGFRLRLLDGGLSVWGRKGGALEGDEFARKALNRLSPLNFFPEKDCGNWVVLDTSESARPESARLFSQYFPLPHAGGGTDFAARYEELLKRESNTPCTRIMIADERGERYEKLERIIGTTAFPDVFFLEGGMGGYRKFAEGIHAPGKRVSTAPGKDWCGGDP